MQKHQSASYKRHGGDQGRRTAAWESGQASPEFELEAENRPKVQSHSLHSSQGGGIRLLLPLGLHTAPAGEARQGKARQGKAG